MKKSILKCYHLSAMYDKLTTFSNFKKQFLFHTKALFWYVCKKCYYFIHMLKQICYDLVIKKISNPQSSNFVFCQNRAIGKYTKKTHAVVNDFPCIFIYGQEITKNSNLIIIHMGPRRELH